METRGVEAMVAKLRAAGVKINAKQIVTRGCVMVQHNVRTEQMAHQSGPPLPDRITARHGGAGLSGAIQYEVTTAGNEVTGHIGVSRTSDAAKYARLHEEGGTITYPRVSAPWWITRQVTATYPARPYLRPGLEAVYDLWLHLVGRYLTEKLRGAGVT